MTFTEAVLAERALLALRDPAGELDAVAPMHRAQAEYLFWLNGGTLRRRVMSLDKGFHTSEQQRATADLGPPEGGVMGSRA